MITGDIRNQIDSIWNDFWAGGVANPLSVIEQITYLLFIKRLDELHTLEERKSQTLKIPMERRIFPDGRDEKGRPYEGLRWSRFSCSPPLNRLPVVRRIRQRLGAIIIIMLSRDAKFARDSPLERRSLERTRLSSTSTGAVTSRQPGGGGSYKKFGINPMHRRLENARFEPLLRPLFVCPH
jgi:hypothetical protein